jgi:hypothetical protein
VSRLNPRYRRSNQALPALVPNLYLLSLVGQIELQTTVCTFYYSDGGAVLSATSESDVVGNFQVNVMTKVLACISQDWAVSYIACQCITTPTRIRYVTYTNAGAQGTRPAGHEPTTVAMLLSRYTAYKGQAGRGRLYLPGVCTSDVTNSNATGTLLTNAGLLATELVTPRTAGGKTFNLFVYSKGTRTVPQKGAAVCTLAVVRPLLATIRRRRIGRGK